MDELGYRDYLGALQRYRVEHPRDIGLLAMSSFLVDYPFAEPPVSRVRSTCSSGFGGWGRTVVLSDGDVVFQPRKVERSGIAEAVGWTRAHLHPQGARARRRRAALPGPALRAGRRQAAHPRRGEEAWGDRVTTVLPRQGQYAHDAQALAAYPPPDLTVERIGDLLSHDLPAFDPRAIHQR